MKFIEVNSPALELEFLKVHDAMNCENPNWIKPLNKDVLEVFDKSKNKHLQHGEAVRWFLQNEKGESIGRIAAFVNKRYKNKGDTFPVGGIGFFDCINDQKAADLLFEKAKIWLAEKGMKAMDGPINFGDRDKWWGLLVDGFHEPIYNMNYNPPYYQSLFEGYGFQVFYNQICWALEVASEQNQLSAKFYESHAKYFYDPDFTVKYLKKNKLVDFAKDLSTVYNKAWAKHEGNKEISHQHALKLLESMKPILDEKLIWFAYHKGEPIVMWINLPDINQVIKHLNGKFGLWEKLKFLFFKTFGKNRNFVGIVFGIVPEFQGKGLDYYLIVEAEKEIKKTRHYKKLELYWQGDFNPKILNISKNLGGKQSRRMVTYRYLFDRYQKFERHPILS
ncbi:hypothetical protein [Cecembia lonarensis]|uniref:N-acetyltransferase domain-containing protein n=1 Tax=Cecembia lonarensis (strain CCUG 58316 / KCTC 22772 / LW9) TaxID=1225176 RepID=K1LDR9_CECL9|nr:hypothetical protein [Cecembia lonarensis]EKB50257.1 hypothetical protein B879_01114 [Cecembia lonarensis LW9]